MTDRVLAAFFVLLAAVAIATGTGFWWMGERIDTLTEGVGILADVNEGMLKRETSNLTRQISYLNDARERVMDQALAEQETIRVWQ